MPLGVGWQDCQSLAHTHTPPMTPFSPAYSSSSHGAVVCSSPHAEVCSFSRWPVDSRAEREAISLTRRLESSCRNRVCLSRVFFCWVRYFSHAQTVEVDFPCESRAHCLCFGDCCLSRALWAVVSNCILGHCGFIVSRFLSSVMPLLCELCNVG